MKKFVLLLILLAILSGCGVSSERYNFSGSSENWDVFYVVNVSNGDREDKSGTVKFTGSGEAPGTIDYKIETDLGGSEGTGITISKKTGNMGSSFCDGCAVMQGDEEIRVEITWNGQTESMDLSVED